MYKLKVAYCLYILAYNEGISRLHNFNKLAAHMQQSLLMSQKTSLQWNDVSGKVELTSNPWLWRTVIGRVARCTCWFCCLAVAWQRRRCYDDVGKCVRWCRHRACDAATRRRVTWLLASHWHLTPRVPWLLAWRRWQFRQLSKNKLTHTHHHHHHHQGNTVTRL